MTEKEAFGEVYRDLRLAAGQTLQETADQLAAEGVGITSRAGVSRLEERGSTDLIFIRAYASIYGKTQNKIEELAQAKRHPLAVV